MSTEKITRSKSSVNEKDPDATAAVTPAMSTTGEVKEVNTDKDPSTLEKAEAPANAPDESDILTGKRLWLIWSAFLLSVLLFALDNTIVSTALPKLASHFNALDQLTWIVSTYLLTQAGFILIFGQILTIVSTKYIYLTVIVLFEVGSLICGVAPSMNVLIFGRAVAGVGASGIFTSILTVVSYATKLEQRPLLFGTFGAVFTFASVAGPPLGGVFTDKVSWRWCFYINLPLGAISTIAIALLLPPRPPAPNKLYDGMTLGQKFRKLDFVGGFLSLAMITLLLIPLQWGGNTRQWNDPVIIGLLAGFGATLILFLLWEWRMGDYALTPFKMFKNPTQTGASIELFFIFFAFLTAVIYLPFLYQAKGRTAVQSGIDIFPLQIAAITGTAVSSGAIRATGRYKPWLIVGPWFAAIAGGLLFTVDVHTPNAKIIGYQIIFGFGTGSAFQNAVIAIQAEFDDRPELIPQASAVASFVQLVGGTLGIAIAGTIFANQLVSNLAGPVGDALGHELERAVRQSVTVIFSLPEQLRQPVVDAYVNAVATMFIVIVPAMGIAGFAAFAIRDGISKSVQRLWEVPLQSDSPSNVT
ncbi:Putative HC-toxin efflux carrier TOXA [Serendipita indica DSM 11827]|nr:Putative HC-toxin efflux carrier TOXA [Serendipita indica DSM 11827]